VLDVRSETGSFQLSKHAPNLTLIFEREDQRIYRFDAGRQE
jgi:hypothetical protein